MLGKKISLEHSQRGFTLIELMVVVLIIGLIATVVTVNVNKARKQGRDAKRISDISSVAQALQAYYTDNKFFPNTNYYTQAVSILNGGGYLTRITQDPFCTYPYEVECSTQRMCSGGPNWKNYIYNVIGAAPNPQSQYRIYTFIEVSGNKTGDVNVSGCGNLPAYILKNGEASSSL